MYLGGNHRWVPLIQWVNENTVMEMRLQTNPRKSKIQPFYHDYNDDDDDDDEAGVELGMFKGIKKKQ